MEFGKFENLNFFSNGRKEGRKEGINDFIHTHIHTSTRTQAHRHKQCDVPYEKEHVCRDFGVVVVQRGKTFGGCERCSCLDLRFFVKIYNGEESKGEERRGVPEM